MREFVKYIFSDEHIRNMDISDVDWVVKDLYNYADGLTQLCG